MKNWWKRFPPYEGEEPYLYFAFADADARRVWPVLRLLLERGCRVWYSTGSAGSAEEVLYRQVRSGGAQLTLLYLTDAGMEIASKIYHRHTTLARYLVQLGVDPALAVVGCAEITVSALHTFIPANNHNTHLRFLSA